MFSLTIFFKRLFFIPSLLEWLLNKCWNIDYALRRMHRSFPEYQPIERTENEFRNLWEVFKKYLLLKWWIIKILFFFLIRIPMSLFRLFLEFVNFTLLYILLILPVMIIFWVFGIKHKFIIALVPYLFLRYFSGALELLNFFLTAS